MKKNKQLLGLFALALGLFTTSCEEKDYTSLHPEFRDMELKMLESGDSTLFVGKKILATCVQDKKGYLLNRTIYNWGTTPNSASHKFRKEVIYDKETFNPTDTLIFEKPGTYNITFNGQYYTSGDFINFGIREEFIEGGKITYAAPTFRFYTIQIKKKVVVTYDEFTSIVPEFSDIKFQVLDSTNVLKAGKKFVATCVQSKQGRLLSNTVYNWTANAKNVTHKFKDAVIYNETPANPTDTLVFEKPGTYELTFNAQYETSGDFFKFTEWKQAINLGEIIYAAPSDKRYTVQIKKKVVIEK